MADNPTALLFRARSSKPHRHSWIVEPSGTSCPFCGISLEAWQQRSRRGRTGGRSGKDGERLVAKEMGMTRVGQFGSPVDVEAPWAVGQVKTGSRFSHGDMVELDRMAPYAAGRMRLLFKVNRPGTGKRKMVQVIVRLSDLLAEFGDVLVLTDMEDWPQWKVADVALHSEKP